MSSFRRTASAARGSLASRAPKIAVPTRTSVAPSAIAASRSADMPIDSVSTASPRRGSRVEAIAQRAELRALPRGVGGRLGDAHDAAQPQPRQRRDRARERQRLRRRDAALRRLAADVDLDADVERRQRRRGRAADSARRDLRPVDGLHPVEALRRRASPCCSAAGRSGATRCPARSASALDLGDRLLHVVLAERALPERARRARPPRPETSC